ncbi:MAG: phenylacetic acid degradation operon negative regulatory protein PaaX [Gammaproteobacteria bacterium]|nr:phenylacetic acid degradation operon negative regulatory protein PaaX [Gammaproteobacteria bacterium]MCP5423522.1 phenylacetic acid degradation operon negative regulatory protein PaaX [Gammaproteobacteria bacterium]
MTTKLRRVEELIEDFRKRRPIRGGSLIITLYGDAIVPRGGAVWLGSLIAALEPLGLNQRLVRTSVYRLFKEGWLSSRQVGRRSFYSVTGSGLRRFSTAFRRIYAEHHVKWDGIWRVVVTSQVNGAGRDNLRRELGWLGFGTIAPGIMAHPMAEVDLLTGTLQDMGLQDEIIMMSATSENPADSQPLRNLVQTCWNLDRLSGDYHRFLARFRPIWAALESADSLDPELCFQTRILLIHEYRRLLLRDPQLPKELLPPDWVGASARLLCRNLYRCLLGPSERYLSRTLITADGPLPEAAPSFYERFGGLVDTLHRVPSNQSAQ